MPILRGALVAALVVTATASGCISIVSPSTTPRASSGTSSVVVPTDASDFGDVTWLTANQLVVQRSSYTKERGIGDARLWQLHPDGSGLAELNLDETGGACARLQLLRPDRLPDGRLGYLRLCFRGTDAPLDTLEALDVASGSRETLVQVDQTLLQSKWAPGLLHGYTSVGGGICDGILGLTRQGTQPAPIVIPAVPRRFQIDEAFDSSAAHDCTQTAASTLPSLSSDGKVLAFLGSPASIGVSGIARTDVPFELYLVNLDSMSSSSLLEGLAHPSGLNVSPDGGWLVTGGIKSGQLGVWLVSPSGRRVVQISNLDIRGLAWAPDGRHIVGLHDPDPHAFPPEVQIIILDVSGVVGS
jgi:hypothetical protein